MRMKSILASALLVGVLLFMPRTSSAQFGMGSTLLGPHLGLAAYGGGISFGANFEKSFIEPGKFGPGIVGISGRFDYFGFSEIYWKYTWIAISACANYHFKMDDNKWDPFLGLGLGYENVSVSAIGDNTLNYGSGWGSGIYISGNAGIRYYLSPAMALRAQAGFGVTYLVLGLDFGL
jgi:hypothetical protein